MSSGECTPEKDCLCCHCLLNVHDLHGYCLWSLYFRLNFASLLRLVGSWEKHQLTAMIFNQAEKFS